MRSVVVALVEVYTGWVGVNLPLWESQRIFRAKKKNAYTVA